VAGLCNGIGNWLNLTSYNYLDLSVSVPIKTGAGLVLSFLISLIVYKERFSTRQIIAVVLGVLAVVLINLA
jgi:multidrug transporter EmrE-like cation transporter